MSALLDFNPVYLVYLLAAASAIFLFEAFYFLCFSGTSYRNNVNRRLRLMQDKVDRETILIQLRRERGLTSGGDYRISMEWLNRLVLQSGLTLGIGKLALFAGIGALMVFVVTYVIRGDLMQAAMAGLFSSTALPYLVLRILRGRRQKKFGAQFPDAIDIIVRSLRAGHPVPIAITMVAREMADPIGSEFGIVADEITYGADLETAMRNLYYRIGQDDLPLFVTAVAIQSSTGGNLGEILENLSAVIRERLQLRARLRAHTAQQRFSAGLLCGLPIVSGLAFYFLRYEYISVLWLNPTGSWFLIYGIVSEIVGILVIRRIASVKL